MSERIRHQLDGHDVEVRDSLHEVPPHEVYEIELDGRRAVYKESVGPRGSAGIEGRVLRTVAAETSTPVPEVLAVGADWFVAAFREDAPTEPGDDERRLEPTWLRVAGQSLAGLHEESTFERPGLLAVDGDPSDEASELVVDSAGAAWSDALDEQLAVYERSVRGAGYADAVAKVRSFLAAHAERFDVLDDREASLCHGWFTPEHVAVREGEPACVIDFEHAIAGSPEWDYWRTAVPLFEGPAWDGPADPGARFRSAYESVRPLPDGFDERADAYRAFVAASHLDSLATQRGIDNDTREVADFLADRIDELLDACRDST